MAQTQGEHVQEKAQLLPTKDTLVALKSDVTLESACLELCDNSLDAWKRTSNREAPATIRIDVNETDEKTSLIIQDDTGGVPREQASMLFGLGQTAKTEASGAIGTFGVGAKKSLVNLGVPFRISSRAEDEAVGWTYRITKDWFEDEENWSVPIYDSNEIPPGTTKIKIEDLNYSWNHETAENLRNSLGEAYNLFLSDVMQARRDTEYDLTVIVDGQSVEPEGSPDWSFTPFDGLQPRRYEDIQITNPQLDEPVEVNITVGLLRKKDTTTAGTDIYCQGRKVSTALRDGTGGYGGGKDRLGVFNPRHERLKVIVELHTNGDGQQLPWDTQKSSIDQHNPIMRGSESSRGVYNWLRRTVQRYFEADADKVPRAFIEPYESSHPSAVNEGNVVCHDFSDRQRVVSKCRPDSDFPAISDLQERVEAHSILGIITTVKISGWQEPAYELQLAKEVDGDVGDLVRIDTPLPEDVLKDPHTERGKIEKLARLHLENGLMNSDDLTSWQAPAYDNYIENHSQENAPNQTEVPDRIPRTPDGAVDSGPGGNSPLQPLQIESSQSIDQHRADVEKAEIFLVFSDGEGEDRGSKVLDLSRADLCKNFGLKPAAGDDVVWEHVRHHLETELAGKNRD